MVHELTEIGEPGGNVAINVRSCRRHRLRERLEQRVGRRCRRSVSDDLGEAEGALPLALRRRTVDLAAHLSLVSKVVKPAFVSPSHAYTPFCIRYTTVNTPMWRLVALPHLPVVEQSQKLIRVKPPR